MAFRIQRVDALYQIFGGELPKLDGLPTRGDRVRRLPGNGRLETPQLRRIICGSDVTRIPVLFRSGGNGRFREWRNRTLIVLQGSDVQTLQTALDALKVAPGQGHADMALVQAGTILATVPLLLLFIATGRHLVSGIMQGAVKG